MAIISLPTLYANAWSAAQAAQASAVAAAGSAKNDLSVPGAVTVSPVTAAGSVPDGGASAAISALNQNTAATLYSSTQTALFNQLKTTFSEFLSAHFPIQPAFAEGLDWISSQLTSGGTGINKDVENALWNRDRDRIGAAAQQAQDEVIAGWAARRFPLPPGAAVYQAAMIQRDALGKMGDSSRERAVQAFLAELENMRFAITQVVSLRLSSLQASGDYIRALSLGPQIGVQLAGTVTDAQARAAQAAVSYYTAQVGLRDVDSKLALANAGFQLDASKTVFSSSTQMALAKANVAIEAARMTGTMAAAALNTFHGNVGYQESNDLTGTLLT